jgi:hypothetical protein
MFVLLSCDFVVCVVKRFISYLRGSAGSSFDRVLGSG